ncbi:hypothetical protein LRB11_13135 [Ectothiorhodospira haloalkaliphila]|uniref:hypothetical protein n=1 Tax=Ectothiorhodospira haloalkaliphila TaxID=421628 RepID=UPI001EE9AE5A|nr:hypothetical protein [Ectothiorhodospira haloalkaliphila]MCG5525865.1 hypothetical protein [Ectothiorhodospira haloalkaliphila]
MMMQMVRVLPMLFLLLLAGSVKADTQAVTVLGMTIGESTPQDVQNAFNGVNQSGVNRFSHGPMLSTNGDVGVRGVKETLFIFSQDERLVAVMMEMPKHRFDDIFDALAAGYVLENAQRPFVGDRSAEFRQGDVSIQLNAPHLSFDMSLLYAKDAFLEQFRETQRREQEAEQSRERGRL